MEFHPDRNPDDPEAEAMFLLVTKAYECLKDEKSRENCEKTGDPDGKGSGSFSVSENKVIMSAPLMMVII